MHLAVNLLRIAAGYLIVCVAQATEVNQSTPAQTQLGFWERPELTGQWFGLRTELIQHGVDLESSLTQFDQGLVGGQGGFTSPGTPDFGLEKPHCSLEAPSLQAIPPFSFRKRRAMCFR
jgi:hypothetical protein